MLNSECSLTLSAARSILNVKLSESPDDDKGNVSVLDLPGDILIVPQVNNVESKDRW